MTKTKIQEIIEDTGAFDCVECGKCTSLCPVAKINRDFAPRLIVVKAQEGMEEEIKSDKDIWSCLTCEICNNMCPYEVDFSGFIQRLRAQAVEMGNVPTCSEAGAVHTMERLTLKVKKQNRLKWLTNDLKVRDKGDVYYFTGCAYQLGTLFPEKAPELRNIPANVVRILNAAGIEPVVSNDEVCCGHDLLWSGNEKSFKKLMERNVEVIRATGAKTVVFSCPEGFRTFSIDYKDFIEDLGFEVKHISEYILDLPDQGKLPFGQSGEQVTYHDSCRLGRHMELYDEPRDLIKATGVELREMASIKEKAICCGVAAFANCSEVSKQMQLERLLEAKQTGAKVMLTFCPKCLIHYNCFLTMEKMPPELGKNDVVVRDCSNFIAEQLQGSRQSEKKSEEGSE
jgi:heterodisulfide reductase subunit D